MTALPQKMNVAEISAPGGPEVLRPAERPVPTPGKGEVLVKVAAVGVNGPDLWQRKGLYPPPAGASDLLGLEISGEVAACGAQASRWKPGDKVVALTNGGGYAEYCVVDERHCLPVPAGVPIVELLVHGGAGGIGTTAIQLARAFGAKVIATDSPAERCAICRELGADPVIDYKKEDFVEVVRAAGGANVILDIVGGPNIERNFKAASHDARIVQLAFAAGSKVEINLMPVMLKRLTYTGSTLRTRPPEYKARIARELEEKVWPKLASGAIRVVTSHTFPLREAAKAHALMESAQHTGKILLTP